MTDFRTQAHPVWSADLAAGDTISLTQARGLNQRRLADFGLTLSLNADIERVTVRRLTAAERRIDGGYFKAI